jgi:rSAM/selenodomain-associated transferase 2
MRPRRRRLDAGAWDGRYHRVISVIIPTLNAAAFLPACLSALAPGAVAGLVKEVIFADGGSTDATAAIAEDVGARFLSAAQGRGAQLVAGAAAARAPWLLFLHADTAPDGDWIVSVEAFLKRADPAQQAAYFRFAFDDPSFAARHAAFWVDVRCRVLALPYGDQGLLIGRGLYDALGGYRPLPLMEDVDLVRRIGPARLQRLATRAVTSAAKYRRDGYLRRSFANLALVARFLAGADPAKLAKLYG